jgi:hypothetical protein
MTSLAQASSRRISLALNMLNFKTLLFMQYFPTLFKVYFGQKNNEFHHRRFLKLGEVDW